MRTSHDVAAGQVMCIRDEHGRPAPGGAGTVHSTDADLQMLRAELAATRKELAHHVATVERVKGELVVIRDLAERVAASHAWRWGHRTTRLLRAATLRPPVGAGAMQRLLARLDHAERALALPLPKATLPTQPAVVPHRAIDDRHEQPDPPGDWRAILRRSAAIDVLSADVVVCVHNALADVHRCFTALLERTDAPFRLIIVDDGSSPDTRSYLEAFAGKVPGVELHRNEGPRHGYTLAANIGLRASTAAFAVLLNSDTVVTRGWLKPILELAASDDAIGVVGPLSNAASHQSVPLVKDEGDWAVNALPVWATEDTVGLVLTMLPGVDRVEVPFVNGFCYAIDRRVIEAVGYLDETTFASGYSEENDFSRRAADAGFRLAVATHSYVYHAKSRSYGKEHRRRLAKRNYGLFLEKHGEQKIRSLVEQLTEEPALHALRSRVSDVLASPQATAHLLPRLHVTFVLPGISRGGSGGSHSIFQEASAMRDLGLPARIAVDRKACPRIEETYPGSDGLFVPYDDAADLASLTEEDDVVVATHHASVPLVTSLLAQRPSTLGAYYVQDYETLFASSDPQNSSRADLSYTAFPDGVLFAKTAWLQRTVAEHTGVPVAKVEPSLDVSIFNATDRSADAAPHVVAMLRPRTPRRAPRETLEVLTCLRETFGPEFRITTFGCEPSALARLTSDPPGEHVGILSRHRMAELLRTADVFVDCSTYQAFGRTGLEAMACGAVPILPSAGGAREFAIHDVNAILVDTHDTAAVADAATRLVRDREWTAELRARGVADARRFTPERAALSIHTLFCRSR